MVLVLQLNLVALEVFHYRLMQSSLFSLIITTRFVGLICPRYKLKILLDEYLVMQMDLVQMLYLILLGVLQSGMMILMF